MRSFYPRDFRDPKEMVAAVRARSYPVARRAAVASILARQAEQNGVLEPSRAALAAFGQADSVAVVAGQQPGLFGGPLYTIYKMLTAASLAREIEAATGAPAVPVFWIASDDHDFDEVRTTYMSEGSEGPTPLSYPAEAAPRGVSAARITFGPAVEALVRSAESLLPPSPFRDAVLAQLKTACAGGVSPRRSPIPRADRGGAGVLLSTPRIPRPRRPRSPCSARGRPGGGARWRRRSGARRWRRLATTRRSTRGQRADLFWHGRERERCG